MFNFIVGSVKSMKIFKHELNLLRHEICRFTLSWTVLYNYVKLSLNYPNSSVRCKLLFIFSKKLTDNIIVIKKLFVFHNSVDSCYRYDQYKYVNIHVHALLMHEISQKCELFNRCKIYLYHFYMH